MLAVASSQSDNLAEERQLDLGAMGRYLFAVLIQMVLMTTAFGVVDVACYGPLPGEIELGGPLPWQAVVGLFVLLSVRSRVFNPLDNSRPGGVDGSSAELVTAEEDAQLLALLDSGKTKQKALRAEAERRGLAVDGTMDKIELERRLRVYFERAERAATMGGAAERVMPSWTPPGVFFPIMWLGVVAPLRAFAASFIYETSTGRLNEAHLNDPVLLWLALHLCIGDTWNTVNNVERRTGAAVPGVVFVWGSALFAARQFYDVAPQAGVCLGLTAVWLTVAALLVADTWRINNAIADEPLYPYKRPDMRSQTRLSFEDN